MIDEHIHKFLWRLTERFPDRTRDLKREGKLYLRRFYLTPRRRDKTGKDTENYMGFGIYLHYFYRGDVDYELHNHPWKRAVSFILAGGYFEERREEDFEGLRFLKVVRHDVKARRFNIIGANDFHRIIKKPDVPHTWSLFITGPRIQDWGFWDRFTHKYTSHKEFVNQADQGYTTIEDRK